MYEGGCASAHSCIVTGDCTTSDYGEAALLLVGSGRSWKAVSPPLPKGGTKGETQLDSVSCTHSSCVAFGSYFDNIGDVDNELVSGSGSKWHSTEAPLPPNGAVRDAQAGDISCGSDSCVAGGSYFNTKGYEDPLLIVGSPGKWTGTGGSKARRVERALWRLVRRDEPVQRGGRHRIEAVRRPGLRDHVDRSGRGLARQRVLAPARGRLRGRMRDSHGLRRRRQLRQHLGLVRDGP